jgi:hypothetical protein
MAQAPLAASAPAPAASRECRNHAGTAAAAYCQECGAPICDACVERSFVRVGPFCAPCRARVETVWTEDHRPGGPRPVPAGARCALHATQDAFETCRRCGNFLCAACSKPSPWEENAFYCQDCLTRLEAEGGGGRIPWEERREGFLARYFKTVGQVLFSPVSFFGRLPARGYVPAITFQYTSMAFVVPLTLLTSWLAVAQVIGRSALVGKVMGQMAIVLVLTALVGPILQFLSAGWLHAHLYLFGARKGFEPTYRLSSYLAALSFPYFLVALLMFATRSSTFGGILFLLFALFALVLVTIAAARVHRLHAGLAFLAVLLTAVEAFLFWRYVLVPLTRPTGGLGPSPFL